MRSIRDDRDRETVIAKPALNVPATQLVGKRELHKLLRERKLLIEPLLTDSQVDETGIDLRLDCFFREFVRTEHAYVSPAEDSNETVLREIEPFRDSFFLQPGEFALAQSLEYLALPNNLLALLNGRSSLGRRGLVVHATANIVDPGWLGHLVFELANLGTMPIQLTPMLRVAKLIFLRTQEVSPYGGQYSGQLRINPPKADPLMSQMKARGLLRL